VIISSQRVRAAGARIRGRRRQQRRRPWIRLPRTLEEYQRGRFEGAIQAALAAADPEFDFSSFNALYVVASMPSPASTIIDDVPLRVDGTAIHSWAWLATGSLERLPLVLIHETGHLLGLPDPVQRPESLESARLGRDDRRKDRRHVRLAPLEAWRLDDDQITCLTRRGTIETTLTPVERPGGKKVLISRMGKAVLVVEVRRAVAEDASLCRAGVLFYRVDFSAGAPKNAGLPGTPVQLRPARRDDGRQRARCGSEWRAPFGHGAGQVSRATAWRHQLTVVRALRDGAYRVRLTRR
jgi:hypothetical protein